MKGFNHVSLSGNIVRDIELKVSKSNLSICKFTLAVNGSTGKGDQRKDTCEFVSCIAFGKTAEVMEKYLHKGSPILIHGSIKTGSYENKAGQKVYTTDVIVNELVMLGGKSDGASGGSSRGDYGGAPAQNFRDEVMEIGGSDDDDIPF